ncbi:hypothetical protein [Candidatus Endomicrobiellum cubanum]|uniref:hypothetical protein n=1 Tax=Candidatus Endomicrobiellum cubanum TaxID=3242325 RepID=UPI00359362A7
MQLVAQTSAWEFCASDDGETFIINGRRESSFDFIPVNEEGYVEGSLTIEFKEPQKSLTIKKGIKATFYQLMTFVATKSKNFNN